MTMLYSGPVRRAAALAVALFVLGACAMAKEEKRRPPAAASLQERITAIPRAFDAQQLAGMDADNVARLLGSPGLLRHDGPAQIWQYVDEACILDLFLYSNGGRHLVEYVEARAANMGRTSPPTAQSCVDAILRDRRPLTS
jgi:hypothetical protein